MTTTLRSGFSTPWRAQGLEGEHRGAERLVAEMPLGPRHVEHPAGLQVVEVLLERLDRVEVVLGQRERLGGAGAEGVGEADLDLVVVLVALARAASARRRSSCVTRGSEYGPPEKSPRSSSTTLRMPRLSSTTSTLPLARGERGEDVATAAAADDQGVAAGR